MIVIFLIMHLLPSQYKHDLDKINKDKFRY